MKGSSSPTYSEKMNILYIMGLCILKILGDMLCYCNVENLRHYCSSPSLFPVFLSNTSRKHQTTNDTMFLFYFVYKKIFVGLFLLSLVEKVLTKV